MAAQEIRTAVVLTGGVSLAVWMGGLTRELNLLVHAGDTTSAADANDEDVAALYRAMLNLFDVTVLVDLVSGTSAGGINAAMLALANVRRADLGFLRNLWMEKGGFDTLLRDPGDPEPISLLQGEGRLHPAIRAAITTLRNSTPQPRHTDLFITTTLLSPETRYFTDSFGTRTAEFDHHGLFRFTTGQLAGDIEEVADPLALAARSTASFPGAFEPAFLPYDADQPGNADITRPHWATDGGVLVNRPIAPLLQAIFDRPAQGLVRRVLLHVVPSHAYADGPEDTRTPPLTFLQGLQRTLTAAANQSIAGELAALRAHNDRAMSYADTRHRLAALSVRMRAAGDGDPLADRAAWLDYRRSQGEWLARPLIAEITRQLAEPAAVSTMALSPKIGEERTLHTAIIETITTDWPEETPAPADAAHQASLLGPAALDAAKAAVLDLLHVGYTRSVDEEYCTGLAALVTRAHESFKPRREPDLRALTRQGLINGSGLTLDRLGEQLARAYLEIGSPPRALRHAWEELAETIIAARPALRAHPNEKITTFLAYFAGNRDEVVMRLLDLVVATRSVLPVGVDIEQPVELIQVSSDTRTLLAESRNTAQSKLTGFRWHEFAAFYKASWRANDWMWGRIDAAGWLVQLLLDPRRIIAMTADVATGERAAEFLGRLQEALGWAPTEERRAVLLGELGFLDNGSSVPASLPELALWAAEPVQRRIATSELAFLAGQFRAELGEISPDAENWLSGYQPGEDPRTLLERLPLPGEKLPRFSPRLIGTGIRAVAVAADVLTDIKYPRPLRPVFFLARAITRTAAAITRTTGGRIRDLVGAAILVIGLGVTALLTETAVLMAAGVVLIAAGATLVAALIWRFPPKIRNVLPTSEQPEVETHGAS